MRIHERRECSDRSGGGAGARGKRRLRRAGKDAQHRARGGSLPRLRQGSIPFFHRAAMKYRNEVDGFMGGFDD
jgi:hypothetical protein